MASHTLESPAADGSETERETALSGASSRLAQGVAVIRAHLETLGRSPGVYRMLDDAEGVLYVGKARILRNRVAAYTRPQRLPIRIQRMIAETRGMEFITTRTEVEALLLENNLIKKLKPRYNILLRDDKSFPEIMIRSDHPFPQILKHRGARSRIGDYFGPFASGSAVTQTVDALERAFRLRTCSDATFAGRSCPCLQYQIKRCSAPCVGLISEDAYRVTTRQARAFLSGHSVAIQATLCREMEQAAATLDYEKAATLRDRIHALTSLQARQDINPQGIRDADVIAVEIVAGRACVQVFFFRGGRNNGNRSWFPTHDSEETPSRILTAFLGQFYDVRPAPGLLLCSHVPDDRSLLEQALSERCQRRVQIVIPERGSKRQLVLHALTNARDALERKLAARRSWESLLSKLATLLGLPGPLRRIEVYDNSHIQGTAAVGAMIVAGPDGFRKNAYRKFNIQTVPDNRGDDYAMMREVLTRRFGRALREQQEHPTRTADDWPDLAILDGGLGQLGAATAVLVALGIEGRVALLAVAKGADRNAGQERLYAPGRTPFLLPPRDQTLFFIQRLRDEAHRLAIGTHRRRRTQAMRETALEAIAGIGARRKKALLLHFGSAKAVARASCADLEAVEGISTALARTIYESFQPPEP